jgi:hypothetical protein
VTLRTHTQYQRGIPCLGVDDDNEDNNEGVAGDALFTKGTSFAKDLPAVPET